MEHINFLVVVYIMVNFKMILNKVKVLEYEMMVICMKVSIKMIFLMVLDIENILVVILIFENF